MGSEMCIRDSFWQNTGYFDGPADLKPLLHTWSLAVEEQFYLGYPLLLILLKRVGRGTTPIVLALLALGSLVLSQYGVNHHPSATFFLLPTRAWELLIGGLICFMPKPTRITPWILNLLSWLSLAAIFAAGWIFTPATPFPGFSALAPCGATAVIIYANSQKPTYPAAILSWRPVVLVGLLSYSLYLWHWPILALWKYWFRNVGPRKGGGGRGAGGGGWWWGWWPGPGAAAGRRRSGAAARGTSASRCTRATPTSSL